MLTYSVMREVQIQEWGERIGSHRLKELMALLVDQ
jgi:hypothetical protein